MSIPPNPPPPPQPLALPSLERTNQDSPQGPRRLIQPLALPLPLPQPLALPSLKRTSQDSQQGPRRLIQPLALPLPPPQPLVPPRIAEPPAKRQKITPHERQALDQGTPSAAQEQIRKATEDFESLLKPLGWDDRVEIARGSYASVYRCDRAFKGFKSVAIKLQDTRNKKRAYAITALKEHRINEYILSKDKAPPHTIRMLAHVNGNDCGKYAAVLEDGGNNLLITHLRFENHTSATVRQIESIAKQSLEALKFFSMHGIVHGDVKPSNLVINKNNIVRFADFGLSEIAPDKITGKKFYSGPYRPPEAVLFEGVSPKSDVWALGSTLFFLWTGDLLQTSTSEYEDLLLDQFQRGILDFEPISASQGNESPTLCNFEQAIRNSQNGVQNIPKTEQFISLLKGMLDPNPDSRLSAEAALTSDFFTTPLSTDLSFHIRVTNPKVHVKITHPNGHTLNINMLQPHPCYHMEKTNDPCSVLITDENGEKIDEYAQVFQDGSTYDFPRQATPELDLLALVSDLG